MSVAISSAPPVNGDRRIRLSARELLAANASSRLLRGITWSGAAALAGQGASVLASVALARALGREYYGQLTLIQSTVVALTSFGSLGLGVTATKYASTYRDTQPGKAGRILALAGVFALLSSSLVSAALVLMAPALIARSLVFELRLSVAYALFTGLNAYQTGALVGMEAFGAIARVAAVNGLLNLLLVWTLSTWAGLRGAVLAQGATALLLWLQSRLALRHESRKRGIRIRLKGAWQERRCLIGFAVPATLCAVLASVAIWRSNLILVRTCGYADFAIFSAANTLRVMIMFIPALITRVTSPALNNMLALGEWAAYRRTFWGSVFLNGTIALIVAGGAAIGGRWVLRLFGREFVPSTGFILLFLGAVVVEVMDANLYQAIFTSRTLWWHAPILTLWSCILVGCSALAIPRLGSPGLALAYLAAWSASAVLYTAAALVQRRKVSGDSV